MVGAVLFWAFGYALARGEPSNSFLGYGDFFLVSSGSHYSHYSHCHYALWFLNLFFAATAATIVSGALAERTEFAAYMLSSCVITGIA